MNEMKNVYGKLMSKQAFFSEVNKLHAMVSAVEAAHDSDFIDYRANVAYNRIVINGNYRPENFGEVLRERFKTATNVSEEVKCVYWQNCWYHDERRGDCLTYPAASTMWAQF